jgi:hypothetical protein
MNVLTSRTGSSIVCGFRTGVAVASAFALACSPAADKHLLSREADAPVRTSALVYGIPRSGESITVTIPFVFENVGPHRIRGWHACHGELHTTLERREQSEWVEAWLAYDHGCPQAIELGPGETHESSMDIRFTHRPLPLEKAFSSDTAAGTYRIVLQGWALRPYDRDMGGPLADSLPTAARISNAFELRASRNLIEKMRSNVR